ncbi:hypothetical protein FQA47_015516 [Oryzias melastigma]|uniref:Uncharacterized protein n=1 Tax=Oryzias melastigma TaxID=30732 RepID=A0A834L1G9_ORYME|nr:hypothetical protein FQA47_015516 [Oryzias melastigma]
MAASAQARWLQEVEGNVLRFHKIKVLKASGLLKKFCSDRLRVRTDTGGMQLQPAAGRHTGPNATTTNRHYVTPPQRLDTHEKKHFKK